MIVAKLKGLSCPDVASLQAFRPDGEFGIHVLAMVGPADGPGKESFAITVCTPKWFEQNMKTVVASGRHHLFLKKYNYDELYSHVSGYCSSCMGETWAAVAKKVARLGYWEFEDYELHGAS